MTADVLLDVTVLCPAFVSTLVLVLVLVLPSIRSCDARRRQQPA